MKIIFDTIKELNQFGYFSDALLTAGLVYKLKASGPWTLFLPLDGAFTQIPKHALRLLWSNPKKLGTIIGYHIIPNNAYMAADLIHQNELKTLSGRRLKISVSDEIDILVDDALITKPDIKCANGVIHIIDSVLVPNPDRLVSGLENRALKFGQI